MDNILPEHQQLNSCLKFIRPSTPDRLKDGVTEAQETLLCSNGTTSALSEPINNDKHGRILLQINTDPLRILYSPPKHDDNIDDAIFQQLNFPHLKRPLLSPTPSNASSASSSPILSPRPVAIPASNEATQATSINKSPAASFLANFMSPVASNSAFKSNQHPDEPNTIVDDYSLGETIGFGGFSTVRKATHVRTGHIVAVKIIQHQHMGETSSTRLDRELSIWRSLDHPNIVHLLKVIHMEAEHISYVFNDYCSGGNLLDYLNKHKAVAEMEARRLFKELCQGIRYLHVDRRVCHKDLKLENILLNGDGHIKICDFGLAIEIPQQPLIHRHCYKRTKKQDGYELETAGGSLAYAAPEQIRQKTPLACPKTDIWSLGVILYTLTVGSLPFMDDYDLRLQQKILDGHFAIPEGLTLSNALKELIHTCLAYEPQERCDIDAILHSKWMNE
ncbi:kinase-like domain-containing protein [Mucor lusitanicus]